MDATSLLLEIDERDLRRVTGGFRWDEMREAGLKQGADLAWKGTLYGGAIGGIGGVEGGPIGVLAGAYAGAKLGSKAGSMLGYAYGAGRNAWDQYHGSPANADKP